MNRSVATLPVSLCLALTVSACGSARFSGPAPVARSGPVYNAPAPEPIEPAPSAPVTSAPLPPPPGAPGPVASIDPNLVPQAGNPAIAEPPPVSPPVVAALPQPATPAGPSRSSYVGGWTAREAAGSSCRVQLSSSPALDLYKASAAGCANKDLSRVTAWDYRDGEVYLYQPGGAVAARLRPSSGGMDGVLAKSGAPVSLAR
ncbi:MAG TPA: AprI/Inh family metalloprotease inhibitor [Beijerinckiaceae bacterium]